MRWMSIQRAGVGLVLADLVADLGMEDFGPAAGQAAQAGFDHVLQDPAVWPASVMCANQLISTAVQALRCSRG